MQQEQLNKSKLTKGHIIAIILIVLILAGAAAFYFYNKNKTHGTIYDDPGLYKQITVEDIKDLEIRTEIEAAIASGGINKMIRGGYLYLVIAFDGVTATAETSIDRQLYVYYEINSEVDSKYILYKCSTERVWVQSDVMSGDILSLVLHTRGTKTTLFSPVYGFMELETYRDIESGAYILNVQDGRIKSITPTDKVITTGVVYTENIILTGFNLNAEFVIPNYTMTVNSKKQAFEFYYKNGIQVKAVG